MVIIYIPMLLLFLAWGIQQLSLKKDRFFVHSIASITGRNLFQIPGTFGGEDQDQPQGAFEKYHRKHVLWLYARLAEFSPNERVGWREYF